MLVYIPSALNENFIKGDLSMALAVVVCVKKYLIFISAYQVVQRNGAKFSGP